MRNLGIGLVVVVIAGAAAACGGGTSAKVAAPESGGGGSRGVTGDVARTDAPPPPPTAPGARVAVAEKAESGAATGPREAPAASSKAVSAPVAIAAPSRRLPRAGQLTAGVWDDNLNFDFFKPYVARVHADRAGFTMFSDAELDAARTASTQARPRTELDVQLVLDTTGSMGDELAYLQSEFDAIAGQLKTKFPNVVPRWSLVVYRDHGDAYVTRPFDFTSDTSRFRSDLRAQAAAGGGDTPEAVVDGLRAGMKQSWRGAPNVAKIAFWVADAPSHTAERPALANVIRDAKAKGVHLYPIASSDADEDAEYEMRSAAQMTGGRYVFLTNDSGVGNDHGEPHIPCYNVTRLDRAIVRMIAVELGGRYVEAESSEVVRAVGQPNKDGRCRLSSGALVASY